MLQMMLLQKNSIWERISNYSMHKYITVYDKYIFKQVFVATCVAILLFTIVWIAPEILLRVIKHIISGETTVKTGVMILLCEIPKILGKAFPMGLLLGTLFTFDKLSKDSELTILRAVGMSFNRIIAPLILFSAVITFFCFVTYDKLIPYSCQKLLAIKGGNDLTQFIYTQKDEQNHPKEAIIVSRYLNGVMSGVIVMDFDNEVYDDLHGLKRVSIAENGKMGSTKDGVPCWELTDVTEYNINDDGIFNLIQKTPKIEVLQGESSQNAYFIMTNSTKRDRDINNKNLKKYVDLLKKENLDEEYRLNYNKYLQRFLHPFICMLLAVLGAILGFSKPREQRLIGFIIAIGFIFAYYVTLPLFDYFAEKGVLYPFVTAAFPPIAFLCAIIAFHRAKGL